MSWDAKPLGDRILIQPEARPTMTETGLHLVEHWKPEVTGTVVAVGPSVREPLAAGDFVIFSWQVGQEVFLNRERFILMREADVSAVIVDRRPAEYLG